MNDTETTPSGLAPIADEVDLALGTVASRLTEIAGTLRNGQGRYRSLPAGPELAALVRNAAGRLRDVQRYAGFAAALFEEEFVEPLQTRYETPAQLQAIPVVGQRGLTLRRATRLLGALAAVLGAALGIWKAISGSRGLGPP